MPLDALARLRAAIEKAKSGKPRDGDGDGILNEGKDKAAGSPSVPGAFETYADARAWVDAGAKAAGGLKAFASTDAYKAAYPAISAAYDAQKADTAAKAQKQLKAAGLKVGDKVGARVGGLWGQTVTGTIIDHGGVPHVKLNQAITVVSGGKVRETTRIRWSPQWTSPVDKQKRHPAGSPQGGQFAPENGSTGGGAHGGGKKPSLFDHLPSYGGKKESTYVPTSWGGKVNDGPPKKGTGGGAKLPPFLGGPGFSGGGGWAPPAPKAPPAGAAPHPQKNDKGETVTIAYPTKPSDPATWTDPQAVATFVPGGKAPDALNGVPLKPWTDAPTTIEGWAKAPGQNPALDDDMPFTPVDGKGIGSGVIIQEPDGRVWVTRPTNAFGGYQHTFPKGTLEDGLSLQAGAIKEAYEETGLQVEITGILGDFERTTSKARYYLARRVGGTPADQGWESQAMRLAPPSALPKLLNMPVDKGIVEEMKWLGILKKARALIVKAKPKKGDGGSTAHYDKQPRWPAGTPLGGQWKAQGESGFTTPPKIGSAANPSHQKKAEAMLALAKAGDTAALAQAVEGLTKKVEEFKAKGATHSQAKWTAQTLQYGNDLLVTLLKAPKVEAQAVKIAGPMKLADLTKIGGKPGGSNPGALYKDAKGSEWLVKGNAQKVKGKVTAEQSDQRARNEVLAAKLINAAGGGAPAMKIVDLEGQFGGGLGVASGMIKGGEPFNPKNKAHVAAIRKDFALHAWLGNYDVLGMGYDNTIIKDGKAVNIDPGGALLFRAQGLPKDAFAADAPEWTTMRGTTTEQTAVFGGMTKSELQESAARLALLDDSTIKAMVETFGPGLKAPDGVDLATRLIERKAAIMAKAGLTVTPAEPAPKVEPKPAPVPPKIEEAAPVEPSNLEVPKFSGLAGVKYSVMAEAIASMHQKGDLAGLLQQQDEFYGSSDNAKSYKAFIAAAIADLEGQKANAIADVAAGMAPVTGKDGTEWQAKDGVLQPVKAEAPLLGLTEQDVEDILGLVSMSDLPDNSQIKAMMMAAMAGDLAAVKAAKGVHASLQELTIAAMESKAAAEEPTAAPAAPQPSPPKAALPAAPDFSSQLLPAENTNAGSHNKKVAAIQAAFEAGDEKALLSLGFGSNNYAAKQVQLANDALAALGSVHQVSKSQKPHSHPALVGGTGQPGTAHVAPPPKPAAPGAKAKPTIADMKASDLPPIPDLANFNGPGSPYSTKGWKQKANQKALEAIQQAALSGGMEAVYKVTFAEQHPDTGELTGKVLPITQHPAKNLVQSYINDVSLAIEVFLNPPEPPRHLSPTKLATIEEVSAKFQAAPILTATSSLDASKKVGFWLTLGQVENPEVMAPTVKRTFTKEEHAAGWKAYQNYSAMTKTFIKHVQGSGTANSAYRNGDATYEGHSTVAMAKAAYEDATVLPPGSTIYRYQNMPSSMVAALKAAKPGLVMDSLGSMCASYHPTCNSGFGKHRIIIRAGMTGQTKALMSYGSGRFANEREITTLPGQRYMLLGTKPRANGGIDVEVVMLPSTPPSFQKDTTPPSARKPSSKISNGGATPLYWAMDKE